MMYVTSPPAERLARRLKSWHPSRLAGTGRDAGTVGLGGSESTSSEMRGPGKGRPEKGQIGRRRPLIPGDSRGPSTRRTPPCARPGFPTEARA
jgi:hypothetical protein